MKYKLLSNQKGIAQAGIIVAAVVVLGLVAFSAYRIGEGKNKEQAQQNTTAADSSNKLSDGKKTYNFEKTALKIDIPESWQASIDEKTSVGYRGQIKASNGWGISFTADQGGYGGGPGCNYENSDPSLPTCPTWKVLSTDKLPTGEVVVSYASNNAGKYENQNHCAVVKNFSQDQSEGKKAGDTFTGDVWTCFGAIEINDTPASGADIGDTPLSMRINVVFPYDLDRKASTDYTNDADYKAVIEALKTLRK